MTMRSKEECERLAALDEEEVWRTLVRANNTLKARENAKHSGTEGLIDLWSERTSDGDSKLKASIQNSDLIDLYSERMLKRQRQ